MKTEQGAGRPPESQAHGAGANAPLDKQRASEAGIPPPASDIEAWRLGAGELPPEQVRQLGHFLYATMFTRMQRDVGMELFHEYCAPMTTEDGQLREGYQPPERLPAELYVERFARRFGFDPALLRRWTEAAARERAQVELPHLCEGGDQERARAAERILRQGIEAPFADHESLVLRLADRVGPTGTPVFP